MTEGWTDALERSIEREASRFPRRASALLHALRLVQERLGSIPAEAEARVAAILGVPAARVREAVTFYGFFSRAPLGRHRIQVCRNLSCALSGGARVLDRLRDRLGLEPGQTSPDGAITLETVECLGRCDESPCMQVDGRHYGSLTAEAVDRILASLEKG